MADAVYPIDIEGNLVACLEFLVLQVVLFSDFNEELSLFYLNYFLFSVFEDFSYFYI